MKSQYLCPIVLVALTATASATQINVSWCPDASVQNPSADPKGKLLMKHAEEAAWRWMLLMPISDNTTWNICIEYEDWGPGDNTAGLSFNDLLMGSWIKVSSRTFWFYDGTVGDDDEFSMEQVLYRDLSPSDQDDFFDGPVPPLMEVGYLGSATATSGIDDNQIDLLSVLMHEMGHLLGVNYAWSEDYDVEPWLIGFVPGVQVKINEFTGAHLADDQALMFESVKRKTRILPSATDLFCIVDDENFDSINLARIDLFGDALPNSPDFWIIPMNWEGGQLPEFGDDVNVRHGGTLMVFGAGNEATNLNIGEPNGGGTAILDVADGADVEVLQTFTVDQTGLLSIHGGTVDANELAIEGQVVGHGTLECVNLEMNGGIVEADGEGTGEPLVLVSHQADILDFQYLDLDGEENGSFPELHAVAGDLEVVWDGAPNVLCLDPSNLPSFMQGCNTEEIVDGFDGALVVGKDRTVTFSRDFAMGTSSKLDLEGAPGKPATIVMGDPAATFWVRGLLELEGEVDLHARTIFDGCKTSSEPGTSLTLHEPWILAGAELTAKEGEIVALADLTVVADSTVQAAAGVFDWDGTGGTRTTIAPKASLVIETEALNPGPQSQITTGPIDVSGLLDVRFTDALGKKTAWGLGGVLSLRPDDGFSPRVIGSPIKIVAGGELGGTGVVGKPLEDTGVNNTGGVVRPSAEKGGGSLTVFGTFEQSLPGKIAVELSGSAEGDYDWLYAGTLYAGGDVEISLAPNYLPKVGDEFFLVRSESEIFGAFDHIVYPPADLIWEHEYVHGGGWYGLRVRVIGP